MKPANVHRTLPGDLRKPTIRMSYHPGYELCVIVSDVEIVGNGTQIPRLPAVIIDPMRQIITPYNVRAAYITGEDNLIARGER